MLAAFELNRRVAGTRMQMPVCRSSGEGQRSPRDDGGMGDTGTAKASAPCPANLYLAGLAPRSRRTQRQAIGVLEQMLAEAAGCPLPWASARYEHTQAVRARLAASYRPATANRMLCALRGVLREAWRLGLTTAEDYHRAADLKVVRGESLPAGRVLSPAELHALFAACADDPSAAGVRDAAILAVLLGAGLRREEAVQLDIADVNLTTAELRVRGKGSKDRQVFAPPGTLTALVLWCELRGNATGPLFVPIDVAGKLGQRRLTSQAIYYALRRRASEAKVSAFSPHDLRRTFCTALLEADVDIGTVAGMMGHASVDTTRRYDRRGLAARRKAAALLHVPVPATDAR